MSSYSYVAVDPRGFEMRGTLEVCDQGEALRRIKQMGLFPVRVSERTRVRRPVSSRGVPVVSKGWSVPFFGGRVKSRNLAVFTRQLATLLDAGMPLLRGLRLLAEQEEERVLKRTISEVSLSIENGSSLAEAISLHPKAFDSLYVSMVRAGEISGALETTLNRQAAFQEKSRKIKGRVKAAMVYPSVVLAVASAILMLLMIYVVPKFKEVFNDLMNGAPLPLFTTLVFRLSEHIRAHFLVGMAAVAIGAGLVLGWRQTRWGRRLLDGLKLYAPIFGPVFRKVAISRFTRTLGTLVGSGVPILQALDIVKETAGNVLVGQVIATLHDNVKEGEAMAPTLKAAGIFPAIVSGMVDVGEQTGALPDLLMKIADNYDEEVDTAVGALTSLLEPMMIILLAVIVGAIVIAMFLPLVHVTTGFGSGGDS